MTAGRRAVDGTDPVFYAPGDFGRFADEWWCRPPTEAGGGPIGRLKNHRVEEHADGTITVAPSILIRTTGGEELYHGWLRRGVWSPA